jgi:hypothetical protein
MNKLTVGVREGQKEKLNALFIQAGVTGYKRKPGKVISAGLQAQAEKLIKPEFEYIDLIKDILQQARDINPTDPLSKQALIIIESICESCLTDHKIRQGLLKQSKPE